MIWCNLWLSCLQVSSETLDCSSFVVFICVCCCVRAQSFTVAASLLDNAAERSIGATVMNVLYYVGVVASSCLLLAFVD